MKPILVRSELTGEVYVVTRYSYKPTADGARAVLVASRKYDVTDDFNRIIKELPPRLTDRAEGGG